MINDVLGREELDSLDIDLSLMDINVSTTRCCATGTCDGPQSTIIPFTNIKEEYISNSDLANAIEIMARYGFMRP